MDRQVFRLLIDGCRPRVRPQYHRLWQRCGPGVAIKTHLQHQIRGAKTKTQMKLNDLPQGALPALPLTTKDEDLAPTYPPVIQQHLNNVKKFNPCVVLTRVGNFYEMYGEQAEQMGPLLNLKVTPRRVSPKTALPPVCMAGFQYFQLDRYLKVLVQDLNKQVAISEEIRNSPSDQVKTGGHLYNRKVVRVITAGTLVDENFVDPYENNYLLSVHLDHETDQPEALSHRSSKSVGLSWVDLSSGDFFTQRTDLASLGSVIARIAPRELILDTSLETSLQSGLGPIFGESGHVITFHTPTDDFKTIESWAPVLDSPFADEAGDFTKDEIDAAALLLDYVKDKLFELRVTLRPPFQRSDSDCMRIDRQSLRGLEIRSTLRENLFQGSLLHSVRRTVTKSGTRLLSQRLVSPSMSLAVIQQRLDLVSDMLDNDTLREDVVALLRQTFDTLRLLQKFSIGKGDHDDLLNLARTIDIVRHLKVIIGGLLVNSNVNPMSEALKELTERLDLEKPAKVAKRIQEAIDEEGLSRQHLAEQDEASQISGFAEQVEEAAEDEKVKRPRPRASRSESSDAAKIVPTLAGEIWIMRKGASKALRQSHSDLEGLLVGREDLAMRLREQLGLNSLVLKWAPQLGHFCHVKGKDAKEMIAGARNITATKSTRTFYMPEWTSLGVQIEEAKVRIRTEEQRVFSALRNEVIENLVKLRRNAAVLDELDVACSSAILAKERNLIRPVVHSGTSQRIIGGRHPMVDLGLQQSGRQFTSNDCIMDDQHQIALITGPNMAGKSTYLRQNALIAILAQTGCFVPADYAEIGLIDRVFSRVGSADDLFNHQSTFMVEMQEVSEILRQATPRSFVIMDEVGRGTTPEDGVAVGFACLQYLHEKNRCRALFATHFHVLADMTQGLSRIKRYCTDVAEDTDGSWIYVHKLREGVNRKSHALKVAQLAGMPEDAIAIARRVLEDVPSATDQSTFDEPARLRAASGSA